MQLLSPPSAAAVAARRRSSVMFSDIVLLHGTNGPNPQQTNTTGCSGINTTLATTNPSNIINAPANATERNVCSSEKMTQTGKITPIKFVFHFFRYFVFI